MPTDTTDNKVNSRTKNDSQQPKWREPATFTLAAMLLIALGIFIKYLLGRVKDPDTDWARMIYLYGSVEAIVFVAVGYIFGREVNRKRAENAEDSAETASTAAKIAEKGKNAAKEKVQNLATQIQVKMQSERSPSLLEATSDLQNLVARTNLEELSTIASKYAAEVKDL